MEIIHIVLGKANPNRMNGVNKVVHQLATEQVKAGKNVKVWGITSNPVHDYPERNFHTNLFKALRFPFAIDRELKACILKHKDAVFHLHGGWIPVFSSLAIFFKKHKIRFVLTPHGAYNEVAMQRSHTIKKIYFTLFEKKLLALVDKVHSIGASEVKGLIKIAPQTNSFLLPYGFDYASNEMSPKYDNELIIGFVGRLDVHTKGLDLLLESFKNFQKINSNSKLWIIGDGEGRSYIENFIKENEIENVVMWGKKFGQQKDELISKMHVFAHPSRNEGLPTSVLEAASFGVPTIVTQATNVASYVSDYYAGIAIADNNIDQLTNAMDIIHNAYKLKENHSFSEGAKRMLNDAFGWTRLVHRYDELYK